MLEKTEDEQLRTSYDMEFHEGYCQGVRRSSAAIIYRIAIDPDKEKDLSHTFCITPEQVREVKRFVKKYGLIKDDVMAKHLNQESEYLFICGTL